jgi:hypothetical protein
MARRIVIFWPKSLPEQRVKYTILVEVNGGLVGMLQLTGTHPHTHPLLHSRVSVCIYILLVFFAVELHVKVLQSDVRGIYIYIYTYICTVGAPNKTIVLN